VEGTIPEEQSIQHRLVGSGVAIEKNTAIIFFGPSIKHFPRDVDVFATLASKL
jgi:hypothetical protein